jgi:hypothetical protein
MMLAPTSYLLAREMPCSKSTPSSLMSSALLRNLATTKLLSIRLSFLFLNIEKNQVRNKRRRREVASSSELYLLCIEIILHLNHKLG